jgi:hypothetical protein
MNVSSWNLGDSNWGPSINYIIIFYNLIDPYFSNALKSSGFLKIPQKLKKYTSLFDVTE